MDQITGGSGMLDITSQVHVVTLPSEAVAYIWSGHPLTVMPQKIRFCQIKKINVWA